MRATTSGAAGTPKRRRTPAERPQQILDAALHEIGERGLAGARLEDIAKRANVAKGTIYLYFPNKEALFQEMIRQALTTAIERGEALLQQHPANSATEQLTVLFESWWQQWTSLPVAVVHRLLVAEVHHFPELMQFYAENVIARASRTLSHVLEHGVERGEFRRAAPATASRILMALGLTHSLWSDQRSFPSLLPLNSAQTAAELLEFFLHALRPDSSLPTVPLVHP